MHSVHAVLQTVEGLLHIGKEAFAEFIQTHIAADPVKEVAPQLLLQAANPRADGRGADVKFLACFLHVLADGNFPEVFQVE